jgi:molecular chaperone GrpE
MNAKTEQDAQEPEEGSLPQAEVVEEAPKGPSEPEEELTPEQLLERERDEYHENWRRVQADFQNHRRRQVQVIDAAMTSARRELFAELLLVLDYLDMALLSPVETTEGKNLLMGVQMTRDQMMQFLGTHEVEAIDSSGTFNPTLHEAIETVAETDATPGTIVETVRRGYTMGSDVLRHAHVKVAADPADDNTEGEPRD